LMPLLEIPQEDLLTRGVRNAALLTTSLVLGSFKP